MDDETRAYLDGEWTMQTESNGMHAAIYGPDGGPIVRCNVNSAEHLRYLLAVDVAEYLMELHAEHVARITEN